MEKKRGKNHRWSDDEDLVIIKHMSESPNNMRKAIDKASEELGIDVYRCRNRWYNHLMPIVGDVKPKQRKKHIHSKPKEDKLPTNEESFAISQQVRNSLDGFLDSMKLLQKQNKMLSQRIVELEKRITDQSRIMRDMSNERRDLDDSYNYILKVMEKARKMFSEDEIKEVIHKVDASGNVEITKSDRSAHKNNVG